MKFTVPPPPSLGFFHPTSLVSTWFGFGLLRPAPGTWGSVAALPFAWVALTYGGWPLLLGMSVALLILGIRTSSDYAEASGDSDPRSVVVDEVVGMWIALLTAPMTGQGFLLAFLFFRFYDILKPWPVSWADKSLKGGTGIMLDDVIAGIYAAICVFLIDYWVL